MTYAYSYPNGHMVSADLDTLEPEFTHNNYGELSEYKIETTTPSTYHYKLNLTYNDGGQITEKIEQLPGLSANTYEYTYDSSGRLTSVDKNSTNISSYTYSNNSNRTSGTFGGATTAYTYDNQDRLLTSGVWSYVYNDNGDLVSKTNSLTTEVWTYTYDEFGSLRQVITPTDTITYQTDAFHRRVKKLVNSTLVVQYGYDIYGRLLAEMDSSGNQIRRYVYGSKQHTPDYFIQNSIDYLMVTDHLGSLRAAIKASDGTILKTMEHDEFGRVISDSSPGTVAFGFAGGLYDHDTGFVRFGARDYDPEIGRWTSKDPILFDGDGPNLYGYVENDPINFLDRTGLGKEPGAGGGGAPGMGGIPQPGRGGTVYVDPAGRATYAPPGSRVGPTDSGNGLRIRPPAGTYSHPQGGDIRLMPPNQLNPNGYYRIQDPFGRHLDPSGNIVPRNAPGGHCE